MKQYRVVAYKESGLGSFVGAIFGSGAKVNPKKFSEFLNINASKGWEVVTMEKNISRLLLFMKREEYLVIMGRNVRPKVPQKQNPQQQDSQ